MTASAGFFNGHLAAVVVQFARNNRRVKEKVESGVVAWLIPLNPYPPIQRVYHHPQHDAVFS
jgi:hypothetical protein